MLPIERLAQTDPYIAASLERVCSGRNVLDDFFRSNTHKLLPTPQVNFAPFCLAVSESTTRGSGTTTTPSERDSTHTQREETDMATFSKKAAFMLAYAAYLVGLALGILIGVLAGSS